MRDSMILAERRDQLLETDVVIRQPAAMFAACWQKLLLIPHTLSRRLVGMGHRAIHDAITAEIYKALRELADFDKKAIKPDWQPGSMERSLSPNYSSIVQGRAVPHAKKKATRVSCDDNVGKRGSSPN
jgi:hypothetical protein